jgi:hypothetical protein
VDLLEIQQCYEKLVTLRGGHIERGRVKEEVKRMNIVDALSIQE